MQTIIEQFIFDEEEAAITSSDDMDVSGWVQDCVKLQPEDTLLANVVKSTMAAHASAENAESGAGACSECARDPYARKLQLLKGLAVRLQEELGGSFLVILRDTCTATGAAAPGGCHTCALPCHGTDAASIFKRPRNAFLVLHRVGSKASLSTAGTAEPEPGNDASALVVDPFFREAFAITPGTPSYAKVLAALPEVFVGTFVELQRIVRAAAGQVSRSFQEQGMPTPPWRRYDSMMARWIPPAYADMPAAVAAAPLPPASHVDAAGGRQGATGEGGPLERLAPALCGIGSTIRGARTAAAELRRTRSLKQEAAGGAPPTPAALPPRRQRSADYALTAAAAVRWCHRAPGEVAACLEPLVVVRGFCVEHGAGGAPRHASVAMVA